MVIKGGLSKPAVTVVVPGMDVGQSAFGTGMEDYPIDVTEITGGADGYNFAMGDLKGRKLTIEVTLVTEFGNYLLCSYRTEKVYVAKPVMLRQVTYDGKTVGGVSYTYTGVNARTASDGVGGEADEDQVITPTYFAGEKILATNMEDAIDIAGPKTYWQEINSCRSWAVET